MNQTFQKPVLKHIGPVYSEPCKTSKMEFFAKIFEGWKLLIILTKNSILDVWQHSEYLYLHILKTFDNGKKVYTAYSTTLVYNYQQLESQGKPF